MRRVLEKIYFTLSGDDEGAWEGLENEIDGEGGDGEESEEEYDDNEGYWDRNFRAIRDHFPSTFTVLREEEGEEEDDEDKEYLRFRDGDLIVVDESKCEGDLWYGTNVEDEREGYFPKVYVEKENEVVYAISDHVGTGEKELSFVTGDEIEVFMKNRDGSWYGTLKKNGVKGFFDVKYTNKGKEKND